MENSSSNQTMFAVYAEPFAVGSIGIGSAGVVGNIIILAAIISSKSLRNKCNYLMGVLAVCDLFSCVGFIHYGALIVSDQMFISNLDCFNTIAFDMFFLNCSASSILMVGVDRLLALTMQVRYKTFSKRVYLPCMVLPGILFSLANVLIGAAYTSDEEIVIVCMPPTAYAGVAAQFWSLSSLVLNLAIILVYIQAYLAVRRQSKTDEANTPQFKRKQELLRSLLIVMFVFIGSYFVALTTVLGSQMLSLPAPIAFHSALYAGCFAAVSVACNVVIYGSRSPDYKKAFRRLLPCTRGAGQIHTLTTQGPDNNEI